MFDEPLIFERGSPGRVGWPVPGAAGEGVAELPAHLRREDDLAGMPEVSELEALRHFLRLSQWNYSAATTLYPLGSCTMKYNPVVNEELARLPGFAALHPLVPEGLAQGALVSLYGANLNAIMGIAKPAHMGVDVMQFNLHKTFSTPHGGGGPGAGPVAVRARLADYLPVPRLVRRDGVLAWTDDAPKSVGRLRAFYGNFGILVRAYAYLARLGGPGLADATRLAVLNANYLRARLRGVYHLPYDTPSLHECVFSDRNLQDYDVHTLDVAKRLLDYGFYAPTIYFPPVVRGALMIEPTETETKETLDQFADAMLAIAEEARRDPARVREAPHSTRLARLDETRAARRPVLRWRPGRPSNAGESA